MVNPYREDTDANQEWHENFVDYICDDYESRICEKGAMMINLEIYKEFVDNTLGNTDKQIKKQKELMPQDSPEDVLEMMEL